MMTWLISQKVMPSFLLGQPPSYNTILEAQQHEPVSGWVLLLNDKPLGWALSILEGDPQGPKEIRSRVHFNNLPMAQLMSGWLKNLSKLIQPFERYQLDARNTVTIDPLGRLNRIDSEVHIDPLKNSIRLFGYVEGAELHVEMRSGDFTYDSTVTLPQHVLLNDLLSPQTQLPNLTLGQTWTVPTISIFTPADSPLEMLHASVDSQEPIFWNNEIHEVWLVTYKNDPGTGFGTDARPRGKLWVLMDGTVIKQQSMVFDMSLVFIRLSPEEAAELANRFQEKPPQANEETRTPENEDAKAGDESKAD